jgi:transposase
MRKNSFNNRTAKGASTQAILMSVFTTLKQRGLNPTKIIEQALRIYITTGKLPALKDFAPAQP